MWIFGCSTPLALVQLFCFHQWDEQTVVSPPEELASQVARVLMSGLAQALPAFQLK